MNNHDFYLTLMSNSSINYFSENSTAHFCNQLPKTIHLDGEWLVGLSEIQYPCNFLTVNNGENIIYCVYEFDLSNIIKNGSLAVEEFVNDERVSEWLSLQLRKRKYDNPKDFIHDIAMEKIAIDNKVIAKYKTKIEAGNYQTVESILDELASLEILSKDNVKVSLNDGSKRINITCTGKNLVSLSFSPTLSLQLGFEPAENVLNKVSLYPANVMLGVPSQLFIYSDIIEPQFIGDTMAKVIRVVVIDNKRYVYGTHHTVAFSQPHYVSVLKREFENIEIDIRNACGEKVPFLFGTVCIKLHFKKQS